MYRPTQQKIIFMSIMEPFGAFIYTACETLCSDTRVCSIQIGQKQHFSILSEERKNTD